MEPAANDSAGHAKGLGDRPGLVVWLAVLGVLGLISIVAMVFGFGGHAAPSSWVSVSPGASSQVVLSAGSHRIAWRGQVHRSQPNLDQLDIRATSTTDGSEGQVRGQLVGFCDGYGQCTLGSLLVSEGGPYDVAVTLNGIDPSGGHLVIALETSHPAEARSTAIGLLGLGLMFLCAVGLLVVIRRLRAPGRSGS